jgi:cytoskeletal protein CcmA (bactofilin family)
MWNKQPQTETLGGSPAHGAASPLATFGASLNSRPANSPAQSAAHLGSSLEIKGQITGAEDLQIDGKVDGPISLRGHELTVGSTARLNSEIHAGEVIVSGKVVGNVHARGRVDIKKDGSIIGDISSARICIEDGAHFKGRIEIDPAKSHSAADSKSQV